MSKTPMQPGTYTAVDNAHLERLRAAEAFAATFFRRNELSLDDTNLWRRDAFKIWLDLWENPPATEPSPLAKNPPLTFDQARALETVWLTWPADSFPYPKKRFLEKSNEGWSPHDLRAMEVCIGWGGNLHAHDPAEAVKPTLPTEDQMQRDDEASLVAPSPANGWLGGLCPSVYDSDIHGDEVLCYSENIHGSSMHPTPKTGYHWHVGNPAASERTERFWPLPAGFPVSDVQDGWVGNAPVYEGPDEEVKAQFLDTYEKMTRLARECGRHFQL